MALNIKNPEVDRLAQEVADMAGETKTEAVRRALLERKRRLSFRVARRSRGGSFLDYLAAEIWPGIPASELGRELSKAEREAILGYGPEGV